MMPSGELLSGVLTQTQVAGWEWLIAVFLWLAGISGMGSVAYYWYRRASLAYTLLISIVLALVFVVADLKRPWNVFNAIITAMLSGTYNWSSWMALGIVLLVVQLILLLAISLHHAGLGRIRGFSWISRLASSNIFLALVGFSGFMVTIYSGFLISQASGISLWNTALIPALWIVSASVCSVALVEIFSIFDSSREHAEEMKKIGVRIGLSIDLFELFLLLSFIYVSLTFISLGARLGAEMILYGELAPITWIGVIGLGIIYPALVGAYTVISKRYVKALILSAALLALIGALLLRYVILAGGVYEPLYI
ncbi:MAG: NrfD/PsrC family molybdoenzyme membrane anchor subunit [Sulfolobales archaeon]